MFNENVTRGKGVPPLFSVAKRPKSTVPRARLENISEISEKFSQFLKKGTHLIFKNGSRELRKNGKKLKKCSKTSILENFPGRRG